MIISHINGGLGNQLFQYAAGRALAHHHKVPFKIDKSYYSRVNFRNYELNNFSITSSYASDEEIKKATNNNLISKVYSKVLPPHKKNLFIEPHFHYYNKFLRAPANTFLMGLWQSEKYFSSIRDIIREEFKLVPKVTNSVLHKGAEMRNENSVSIHIRRGDYEHSKVQEYLGLLPVEYYQRALNFIQDKVGEVKIYFFSDDIEFVRKNFAFENSYELISSDTTKNHYEDFYLMQQCKHNIIANSTFSWWGAWLNNYHEKTVVAPKSWFNNQSKSDADLIPENWFRL